MRRRHALIASLTLAAISLAPDFSHAQVQPQPVVTFDAVTAYNPLLYFGVNTFRVTGVQHGASAPSTVFFYLNGGGTSPQQIAQAQSCERQLLIAINRPGRFSVSIAYTGTAPPATGSANVPFGNNGCTLTQLP